MGICKTAADKIKKRRLEWLGHFACIADHRSPKVTLFEWFPKPCSHCAPRRRWRDGIRRDVKDL